MKLVRLGTDHHSTAVALRERLAFSTEQRQSFFTTFRTEKRIPGCHELAILSTCNRIELYAAVEDGSEVAPIVEAWAETTGVDSAEMHATLSQQQGIATAQHLSRVAAGLNSIVVGEPQILGQVTQAFEDANRARCTGPYLRAMFRSAIRTGKRARTETEISRNAASISSVAVALAKSKLGKLADKHVVLIGAGKMGMLALKSLKAHRVTQIDIINRSRASALELADTYGGTAHGFEALLPIMQHADVVISATGAPHTIIDGDFMRQVVAKRQHPLVLIDIAVPRDVEPNVQAADGVHLYDVDALQSELDGNLAQRKQAIPQVEAIIADEVTVLERQLRELSVRPTIHDLRCRAEEIRQREFGRMLRHVPHVDDATRAQLEKFSHSLIKKLLHEPTLRLREEANRGNGRELERVTRQLFDL